jgi:hypothetical protein
MAREKLTTTRWRTFRYPFQDRRAESWPERCIKGDENDDADEEDNADHWLDESEQPSLPSQDENFPPSMISDIVVVAARTAGDQGRKRHILYNSEDGEDAPTISKHGRREPRQIPSLVRAPGSRMSATSLPVQREPVRSQREQRSSDRDAKRNLMPEIESGNRQTRLARNGYGTEADPFVIDSGSGGDEKDGDVVAPPPKRRASNVKTTAEGDRPSAVQHPTQVSARNPLMKAIKSAYPSQLELLDWKPAESDKDPVSVPPPLSHSPLLPPSTVRKPRAWCRNSSYQSQVDILHGQLKGEKDSTSLPHPPTVSKPRMWSRKTAYQSPRKLADWKSAEIDKDMA